MTEREAMDFLLAALRERKIEMAVHREAREVFDLPVPEDVRTLADGDPCGIDAIICRPCDDAHPLLLLDNEIGQCRTCGRRVQFRPHCPTGEKTCIFCAVELVRSWEFP